MTLLLLSEGGNIIADFLSPHISHLHSSDPTIRELKIAVEDRKDDFNGFLLLAHGGPFDPDDCPRDFFLSIAHELKSAACVARFTHD
jgi:hypothetical protein